MSTAAAAGGVTSVLFSVDELSSAIAARRLSTKELEQQRTSDRRHARRQVLSTGGSSHAAKRVAEQRAAANGRFAPTPWNDRLAPGWRHTKGNARAAGSWIPPWSYVPQEPVIPPAPAPKLVRPTFSGKPAGLRGPATITKAEQTYQRAAAKHAAVLRSGAELLEFSAKLRGPRGVGAEPARAELREAAAQQLRDETYLALRVAQRLGAWACDLIVDRAWAEVVERERATEAAFEQFDDGDDCLSPAEVRELLAARNIGLSAEKVIRDYEAQAYDQDDQAIGTLRRPGRLTRAADVAISKAEYPDFLDFIETLDKEQHALSMAATTTAAGGVDELYYDDASGMWRIYQ